jgi:hypothetical protein
MDDPADKNAEPSPPEKVFKVSELLAAGPAAVREYRERQRATLENMNRLRALRLAQTQRQSSDE